MAQPITSCMGVRNIVVIGLRVADYTLSDFGIAERFGAKAIKDSYKRSRAEWKKDKIYGTELSMVLNNKCWYWYGNQNEELSRLYAKLWEEYHGWVLDNWKGEDLGYCLRGTN